MVSRPNQRSWCRDGARFGQRHEKIKSSHAPPARVNKMPARHGPGVAGTLYICCWSPRPPLAHPAVLLLLLGVLRVLLASPCCDGSLGSKYGKGCAGSVTVSASSCSGDTTIDGVFDSAFFYWRKCRTIACMRWHPLSNQDTDLASQPRSGDRRQFCPPHCLPVLLALLLECLLALSTHKCSSGRTPRTHVLW